MIVDAALKAAFKGQGEPEGLAEFIDRVLEDYRPEELPDVSPEVFAERVADFWRWGVEGPARETRVRLVRAESLDLLEIAEPDAPFLVDSVMGELGDEGLHVKAMFHPIVNGGARRRSLIQVWLEPVPEDRRESLVESIHAVLRDVAEAVADFPAMRALLRQAIEELKGAEPQPGAWSEELALLRWLEDNHFVFLGVASLRISANTRRVVCGRRAASTRPTDRSGCCVTPPARCFGAATSPRCFPRLSAGGSRSASRW